MARRTRRPVLFVVVLALVLLTGLAWSSRPASALPAYIHGAAQSCEACHHSVPPSFQPCSTCHESASVPNQKCIKCHPGKTTAGATCWSCHTPGQQMPPPTTAACVGCHGEEPHLGANTGPCTGCHSTSPTPHHDAVGQQAPTCTTCHQHADKKSHNGFDCTACHSATTHPSLPQVPAACNACHPAGTFNGKGDCTACHAGTTPYDGQTDNDIHDNTIPDAPISAQSCTSCHPGKQKHAGQIACRSCHTDATAFHHGTAASPGFKECVSCHGQKPQHGSGLPCTACHAGAQHQAEPPRPASTVCNICHAAATFGSDGCYRCHKPPIYHGPHAVGGCSSCHGTSRASHAGRVACTTCHRNIFSGHHTGRVTARTCTSSGCHVQQKHVGRVWCTSCHGSRAMHDRTPLNLPANKWMVCDRCHTFADQALAAGVAACNTCHDATYHSATYRVQPCSQCHADKKPHAGTVACKSCHYSPGPGHHKVGAVVTRKCSECHAGAAIHASGTTEGASFTCGTCHEGSVHGVVEMPKPERCQECHQKASKHADGLPCLQCHWPAVHAAVPKGGTFGSRAPMPIETPTTTTPGSEADSFAPTGSDLFLVAAAAGLLLLAGWAVRRRA